MKKLAIIMSFLTLGVFAYHFTSKEKVVNVANSQFDPELYDRPEPVWE